MVVGKVFLRGMPTMMGSAGGWRPGTAVGAGGGNAGPGKC